MADYNIELDSLDSKKGTFESMKEKVDTISNNYNSSSVKQAKQGYDKVAAKITTCIERLTNGYGNSNSWLNDYLVELKAIESSLTNFTSELLEAPIEFKGTFEDIFGKVTMPAIKTGGDPNCNENLLPHGLKGDTPQEQIFYYLREKGFNNAAICGILANIQYESNFNISALGDGGTSYGICQWHNGRWTSLKNYCNENGYNWQTLEGQLEYLMHELETGYQSVYNTLRSVPNTAQGAYDAAYKWTWSYEIPARKEQSAPRRGGTAANTYWSQFGNL